MKFAFEELDDSDVVIVTKTDDVLGDESDIGPTGRLTEYG